MIPNQHHRSDQEDIQKFFYIQSCAAGRVLDISQDGSNRGQLIIWDNHKGTNQQFSIIPQHLEVMFLNRKSGLYLTVGNNSDKNGVILTEQPLSHQRNQRFRLQEVNPGCGEFVIFTFCGKALDICENSHKNGTRIIQWDFHSEKNQKWTLKAV